MSPLTSPRFEFAAEAVNLSAARNVVRGFLSANGWANKELDVNIAIGEVLQNVIRYGFGGEVEVGSFWLKLEFLGDELVATIEDDAQPSDPKTWSSEHREAHEGGHGLKLVYSLASSVHFEALDAGNRAVLRFAKS